MTGTQVVGVVEPAVPDPVAGSGDAALRTHPSGPALRQMRIAPACTCPQTDRSVGRNRTGRSSCMPGPAAVDRQGDPIPPRVPASGSRCSAHSRGTSRGRLSAPPPARPSSSGRGFGTPFLRTTRWSAGPASRTAARRSGFCGRPRRRRTSGCSGRMRRMLSGSPVPRQDAVEPRSRTVSSFGEVSRRSAAAGYESPGRQGRAACPHLPPEGSRFSDGPRDAFHAGNGLDPARPCGNRASRLAGRAACGCTPSTGFRPAGSRSTAWRRRVRSGSAALRPRPSGRARIRPAEWPPPGSPG